MDKRIYLSSPHMGSSELSYIHEAFDTNWIAPLGPHVDGFEKELGAYINIPHVAALSSGTAAIHLALILLGVGPGDIVLCQSFTFSASANPIRYQGATPVFIDSERDTWNMDPKLLKQALDELKAKRGKVKAIIPVHLYGMPAKMNEIMDVANHYNIPVIEDAAEALGSKYHDQSCGSFGQFGVYSFNGNKIITTSGGGALVGKDKEMIHKARFLASQASDPAPHYQHSEVGYNYRLSNICAGIGRGQLKVLDDHISKRRNNYNFYQDLMKDIDGVTFLTEADGVFSNRWLTTILIDFRKTGGITREDLRLALEADNIEARPLWKPMHLQPVFAGCPVFVNGVSEKLFEQGLCLPSGSNLTEEDQNRISAVIKRVFQV